MNLKILKKYSNNICVTFEGKIKHSSLEIKRRKTTGENREHYKVLLKDNESSSKLQRLGLLKLSGNHLLQESVPDLVKVHEITLNLNVHHMKVLRN